MLVMVSVSQSGPVRLITTEAMVFAGNFLLSQHAEWSSGVFFCQDNQWLKSCFPRTVWSLVRLCFAGGYVYHPL
jgi:hypothetical protein